MKTIIRLPLLAIAFAVALTFSVVPALSQDKPADTMQLVREKLHADKKLLIAENMQLTESEAKPFWVVYEDYQKKLDKLGNRLQKLIKDYADNYGSMSDAAAKKMMDGYLAIEKERLTLMQSYLPKFRKVLPEKKVTRYYQIENKINAAVNYELAEHIPLIR
jgi:hypothetical protein